MRVRMAHMTSPWQTTITRLFAVSLVFLCVFGG